MKKILLNTYKNGNKLWEVIDTCPRCGGTGKLPHYYYNADGECFQCWGSGIATWTEKEVTEENREKALKRREAKLAKEREKVEQRIKESEEREAQQKAEAERRKQEREAEKARSNYQGEVGQKIEVKVAKRFTTSYKTRFGETKVHIMTDAEGNVYVWKTSASLGYWTTGENNNCEWNSPEADFTVTGTVKEHTEYKGTKQTVLTRCKVTA